MKSKIIMIMVTPFLINSSLVYAESKTDQKTIIKEIVTTMTDARSSTVNLLNLYRDGGAKICAGTLISKNLILTAAHCIPEDSDKIAVVGFGINLKESILRSPPKHPTYKIKEIKPYPSYEFGIEKKLDNSYKDLAIFKFNGELPEGFKIRQLPKDNFQISSKDTLELLGYGKTSVKQADDGTLRRSILPATDILNKIYTERSDENGEITRTEIQIPKAILLNNNHGAACEGDSGGPLFVKNSKNELILIGVLSQGVELTENSEKCTGYSIFVDLRQKLDWIQKTMNELNSTQ
ncbi:hypothetical protein F900_01419 [Acinetobacter modestus]|uniref:Peptidase S1 domain-containing protein n=1 Tax=Acinetobacter modestus TaxID=1776740 RepID=N9LZJ1_9GAMM|nr:trypsin-like serine protease [Acinetobacter modestus]ENX01659.1 hypothetical protein F900_01419 [Acinetobacter modestus]